MEFQLEKSELHVLNKKSNIRTLNMTHLSTLKTLEISTALVAEFFMRGSDTADIETVYFFQCALFGHVQGLKDQFHLKQ
jgi:hypothetical protein